MKMVSAELIPLHPDGSLSFHRTLVLTNPATDAQLGADHRARYLASFVALTHAMLSLSSTLARAGKVDGFFGQRAHLLAYHAVLVQPPRQAAHLIDGCLAHHLHLFLFQG